MENLTKTLLIYVSVSCLVSTLAAINYPYNAYIKVACTSGRKCLYSLVNFFKEKFEYIFSEASDKPIPKMNRNW